MKIIELISSIISTTEFFSLLPLLSSSMPCLNHMISSVKLLEYYLSSSLFSITFLYFLSSPSPSFPSLGLPHFLPSLAPHSLHSYVLMIVFSCRVTEECLNERFHLDPLSEWRRRIPRPPTSETAESHQSK